MSSPRRARNLEDGGWRDDSPDHRIYPWRITIWLILTFSTNIGDPQPRYLAAILIGLAVIALYPWLIGIWFVRRRKAKRDDEIQDEVQKQLAEERSRQG